ncbi:hypothetical protein OF83DRAFT_406232 [Amylostereum chailletii]|nr:hypothetical protein OF83DRAFT_406232 [Amylostereum chailletii]
MTFLADVGSCTCFLSTMNQFPNIHLPCIRTEPHSLNFLNAMPLLCGAFKTLSTALRSVRRGRTTQSTFLSAGFFVKDVSRLARRLATRLGRVRDIKKEHYDHAICLMLLSQVSPQDHWVMTRHEDHKFPNHLSNAFIVRTPRRSLLLRCRRHQAGCVAFLALLRGLGGSSCCSLKRQTCPQHTQNPRAGVARSKVEVHLAMLHVNLSLGGANESRPAKMVIGGKTVYMINSRGKHSRRAKTIPSKPYNTLAKYPSQYTFWISTANTRAKFRRCSR